MPNFGQLAITILMIPIVIIAVLLFKFISWIARKLFALSIWLLKHTLKLIGLMMQRLWMGIKWGCNRYQANRIANP